VQHAATHSDLRQMVDDGQFREDLFYRLNVIPVHVPPLRERKEDIPLLVQHFLEKFAPGTGADKPAPTVSQEAMRRLMAYHWPGNVRQLENAIERAVAFAPAARTSPIPPKCAMPAAYRVGDAPEDASTSGRTSATSSASSSRYRSGGRTEQARPRGC
jgi:DNA-binding NtrC family response regulator